MPNEFIAIGGETQINTYSTGDQRDSTITTLVNGGYVITWMSHGQDGTGWGIYAQRFNSEGVALGSETLINSTTVGAQTHPVVTELSNGNVVISWTDEGGADGNGTGVFSQTFTFDMTPPDAPLIVSIDNDTGASASDGVTNDTTLSFMGTAVANAGIEVFIDGVSVGMTTADGSGDWVFDYSGTELSDGDYVLTAASTDAAGNTSSTSADFDLTVDTLAPVGELIGFTPEGSEAQVNTETTRYQRYPSITSLSDGGYVITWESNYQDGDGDGIYAQRYDSAGVAVGVETQVNTYTEFNQSNPSITSLSDGGYIITWQSFHRYIHFGIYAQRYDSTGAPVGTETLINTTTVNYQVSPSITSLSDGGYVIVWSSDNQDGDNYGIYAQRYDSAGNAVGGETLVNTYTTSDQWRASITSLGDGGYVVTWTSNGGQDGDGSGIYAQRYDSAGNAVSGETLVNTHTTNDQWEPSITSLSDGGYVITWTSSGGQDGFYKGIYAQRYDSAGTTVGAETLINTFTSHNQQNPSK